MPPPGGGELVNDGDGRKLPLRGTPEFCLVGVARINFYPLKDPSQARLCYCFDLKFAIKLLFERDKTSQQFNW